MKRLALSAGLAAISLSACAHYTAAPPKLDQFPAALEARRLEEKPAGATWSGADLLTAALARNPQVAEAKAKYLTAVAAARTAKLSPGLTLTLTGEYADEKPTWGYGAAADLPVDAGVRKNSRVSTADLQALQAWYDYAEMVWTVRAALETARIEMAGARDEVALADQAVALRSDRLARLQRRMAAGEDDHVLALTAQTELAAAEQRVADAQGRREQAAVALAKAVGVAPAQVRSLSFEADAPSPTLDGLADWRREATLSRRDVLRALADYDLAEDALRLEIAKQYPEVRIGPGYNYDHGVDKLPFNLTLALPSYDLNRRAIAQAEAARAASGRSLEALQADILAGVDTAASSLETARRNLDRVETRALPAARRTAADTARSVQAGAADRVDDLAARAAELDAQLSLLDARRTTATALADLEDALRRPFDPAETRVLQAALTPPGGVR
jgi:outer membrane protein TolC